MPIDMFVIDSTLDFFHFDSRYSFSRHMQDFMNLGNDAHVLQYSESGILKFNQCSRFGCKLTARRLNDERDGNVDLAIMFAEVKISSIRVSWVATAFTKTDIPRMTDRNLLCSSQRAGGQWRMEA
jgi:hypothetical protein